MPMAPKARMTRVTPSIAGRYQRSIVRCTRPACPSVGSRRVIAPVAGGESARGRAIRAAYLRVAGFAPDRHSCRLDGGVPPLKHLGPTLPSQPNAGEV